MNSKLNKIQNWPELAYQASWSVSGMAELCGVSVRTLERHFLKQFGKSPIEWLAEKRQNQARRMLNRGSSVKETAASLGYEHSTNFIRKFKKYWGRCPARKQLKQNKQSQK